MTGQAVELGGLEGLLPYYYPEHKESQAQPRQLNSRPGRHGSQERDKSQI